MEADKNPLKSALKKAPEKTTEVNEPDIGSDIDRSDPVAWEKAANAALTAAKRECERHPKDEQRKRRYTTLKEDYKAAAKAKSELNAGAASKRTIPKKKSKPCNQFLRTGSCEYAAKCRFSHEVVAAVEPTEGGNEDWMCPTCELVIKVSEKDAHNKTKRHLKALHLQEKATLMWRCIPCQITIGASMRATHEAGKKHGYKVRDAKAGDWFCRCGQHNYATKTVCVKIPIIGAACGRKREFKGNIEIGTGGVEWDPSEHPALTEAGKDNVVGQDKSAALTKKDKKRKKKAKDKTAQDDQEEEETTQKKRKRKSDAE